MADDIALICVSEKQKYFLRGLDKQVTDLPGGRRLETASQPVTAPHIF